MSAGKADECGAGEDEQGGGADGGEQVGAGDGEVGVVRCVRVAAVLHEHLPVEIPRPLGWG
uniref:hypothetical protein n=1 Tax=Salinispora fenicalii TaxID=1137263 RepID=UPI0012BD7031